MTFLILFIIIQAIDVAGYVISMESYDTFKQYRWRKIPFIWLIYSDPIND